MHLIQLFLPLTDKQGRRFPREPFLDVERELVEHFEGFTAYPRAPASGLWLSPTDDLQRDELIVYEVLVEKLNISWWKEYQTRLEQRFQQDAIHLRATVTDLI